MKNEIKIIRLIRYAPVFFIFFISLLTISFIAYEHTQSVEHEKKFFKEIYVKDEMTRIDELINLLYKYIDTQEENKTIILKEQLKNHVDNAYKIVSSIHTKYKDTKSKDEILELIKNVLGNIEFYKGRAYYFIFELDGKNVLNPHFSSIEGKNLWDFKDARGVYIVKEMKKILSKQDSTFYEWYWKKIDKSIESKKIGYFRKFEPYNIFIGMGEYVDDFNEQLKNETIEYINNIKSKDQEYVFLIDENMEIFLNNNNSLLNKNIFENSAIRIPSKEKEKFLKIRNSNSKGEFITYELFNEKTNEFEKKISYITWFDKWKWYVGTGFKESGLKELAQKREKILDEVYKNNLNNILYISGIIIVILMILSYMVSLYLEKVFEKYKRNINKGKQKLLKAQEIALMGDWEYCLVDKSIYWSNEIYNILEIKDKPKKISREFLDSLIHKDDLSAFKEGLKLTISKGIGDNSIYRIYDANNQLKYINFKSEKISDIKLVGIIQDITSRVISEQEKDRNEKLLFQQSKLAAMGEMIGNIAHQWRQPLSTISTLSTGIKIQKEHNILDDKELVSSMETINNATQYLSNTIDDFKNFFEPKKDKLMTFSILETLSKALKLVSAQFSNRNIEIIENIKDINIKSLENELVQVLINILNNARDAFETKKDLEDKLIFINTYEEKDDLIIEIYDNAGGIKEENLDRIFEPYFTTKHKYQGTGIGLYMSREIVHNLLKGNISAENYTFIYKNVEYTGAKFIIRFNKNGDKIS